MIPSAARLWMYWYAQWLAGTSENGVAEAARPMLSIVPSAKLDATTRLARRFIFPPEEQEAKASMQASIEMRTRDLPMMRVAEFSFIIRTVAKCLLPWEYSTEYALEGALADVPFTSAWGRLLPQSTQAHRCRPAYMAGRPSPAPASLARRRSAIRRAAK